MLERKLGAGGMGVVYQALDRERGERVAVKTLSRVVASHLYRFKREFRALEHIVHPNLARLYELFSHGDQWFFTMELVQGTSFLEWVRPDTESVRDDALTAATSWPSLGSEAGKTELVGRAADSGSVPTALVEDTTLRARSRASRQPLDLERLRGALPQLIQGVSALHRAGKLHRDIKPSNVLVTESARVVVLDFGLITELTAEPGTLPDAELVGTMAYMSPEAAAGRPLGPASDWYSVGVMLYEALTGRLPFAGRSVDVLAAKLSSEPLAPHVLDPRLPRDLCELAAELLRPAPDARPTGDELLSRVGAVPDPPLSLAAAEPSTELEPFVGRDRELAELGAAFAAVDAGHPVAVFVEGASGMGKSSLVRRFLDELPRGRARVLVGRCYERESVPYKGLDGLIDALTDELRGMPADELAGGLPAEMSLLARLFPVLTRVAAVRLEADPATETSDPLELRWRAFAALRELCGRLAARRPLVLFIDDVQWSDLDSAACFAELLRPPDAPRVLFLAAFRSEESDTSPILRALTSRSGLGGACSDVRAIRLAPISEQRSSELALELVGQNAPQAPALASAIAAEARGSPFLVHELVRYALALRPHETDVPALPRELTLERALSARLALLPRDARRLLELVAVAGRPLEQQVAVRAASFSGAALDALGLLRATQFVRTTGAREYDHVETYHDRIRESVVAALDQETLSAHHGDLARELERSGRADPEELAVHFAAAGDRGRAGSYAELAASQAEHALAFDRAARLYELARDALDPESPRRRELGHRLGEALVKSARGERAAREFLMLAEDAEPGQALELRRRAAEQLLRSGHYDAGIEAMKSVLSAVGIELRESRRDALVSLLVSRLKLRLRGLGYVEQSEHEIPAKRLALMDACFTAAIGLGLVDSVRGAALQTRHLLLALDSGEPHRVARGLAAEAIYAAAARPCTPRTQHIVDEVVRLAARLAEPHPRAMGFAIQGITAYLEGRFSAAAERCARAEALLRDECRGVAFDIGSVQLFALSALTYLGRLREVRLRVPALVGEARQRGDLYTATALRTGVRNVAWLVAGDVAGARQEVEEAMRDWSKSGFHVQHFFALLARTQIDLYTGDGVAALARVEAGWSAVSRALLLRVRFFRVEIPELRARAALAAAISSGNPATLRVVERDARRIEHEPLAWAAPMAKLLRAGIAAVRREPARAAELYRVAADELDASSMALHAAVARRRLGELLGSAEGRALIEASDALMAEEEIADPDAMAQMLAPSARG